MHHHSSKPNDPPATSVQFVRVADVKVPPGRDGPTHAAPPPNGVDSPRYPPGQWYQKQNSPMATGLYARLSGAAVKVYEAMCFKRDSRTHDVAAKINDLADLVGLSAGHASRARAELVDAGLVEQVTGSRGKNGCQVWRVTNLCENSGRIAPAQNDDRDRPATEGQPRIAPAQVQGCAGAIRKPPGIKKTRLEDKTLKAGSAALRQQTASAAAEAADEPEGASARREPRAKPPRVLTDEQQQTRLAFSDWWMSAEWPRHHNGATYGFEGGRDGPAVLRLLRHPKVNWDLARAQAIARFYLQLKDPYLVHRGKPLPTLAERVNYFASKLDQLGQEGSNHVIGIAGAPTRPPGRRYDKPNAEQRGEFAEPDRPLPVTEVG
jgi:hypothetical protein